VDLWGIEPQPSTCKTDVLPLSLEAHYCGHFPHLYSPKDEMQLCIPTSLPSARSKYCDHVLSNSLCGDLGFSRIVHGDQPLRCLYIRESNPVLRLHAGVLSNKLDVSFSHLSPQSELQNLERETRLELATSTLARLRSTN
jgi:hypothetical protein